jgi:hypothetical protein
MTFMLSIEPIAKSLLGDPNRQLSSKTELRYGTRGSLAIDLKKDTWFDHETNTGGGVLDLITRQTGLQGAERSRWLRDNGFEEEQQRRPKSVIVAEYPYQDEYGVEQFQVVKFDPKDFRQRRRDKSQPGGWIWSVKGVPPIPYRLPELKEAIALGNRIFIVEGEKDVERLLSLRLPATTNAGGAGKWRPELTEVFRGFDGEVIIIPDKDPQKRDPKTNEPMFHEDGRPILPGQDHAQYIAESLTAINVNVKVLELWKFWIDMPDKGDVSKWLDSGGGSPELLNKYADQIPEWSPQQRGNGHDKDAPVEVRALLPFQRLKSMADEIRLSIRDWILYGLLMRKQVTVLVAPSGAGKSLLTLQIGIACASGIAWGGWRLRRKKDAKNGGYRVLFINAEDDYEEICRRLAAAMRVMPDGIDRELLAENFMVAEADKMVIAKFDPRTKNLVHDPKVYPSLVQAIKDNKIDIVVVDPFAETFSLDENSNNELKGAGVMWRGIARETNTALMLVHHTKKYATGMAGDVDAARGASALIGIARIVSTLFPMTDKESELLLEGKKERRFQYLRFDDAKANLNLASTVARWFRKDTITLGNGDPNDPDNPPDQVGTLIPVKLGKSERDFLEADIIRFLQAVDTGILDKDGKHTGEYYTFDTHKAKNHELPRYVGDFAKEFFNFPQKQQAVDYIDKLVKEKRLVKGPEYRSKNQRRVRTRCISELNELVRDKNKPFEEEAQLFPAE